MFAGLSCKSNPCEQICTPTPVSARCACKQGYFLSANGHSCIDIDECAEEKCSQICHNTPGGFNCSCAEDFILKSDRVTCKAKGDGGPKKNFFFFFDFIKFCICNQLFFIFFFRRTNVLHFKRRRWDSKSFKQFQSNGSFSFRTWSSNCRFGCGHQKK